MSSNVTKTYNFSLREQDGYYDDSAIQIRDKRNNFVSDNSHYQDFQGYVNYLKTLQTRAKHWVSYGYFDFGMIPLAMGPSHLQPHLLEFTKIYCARNGITCYELPAAVLMPGGFSGGMKDIWVFRKEFCDEIGYTGNPLTYSIIDYIEREVKPSWQLMVPQNDI